MDGVATWGRWSITSLYVPAWSGRYVSEKKGRKTAMKPPEGKLRYESCDADWWPAGFAPRSVALQ